QNPRESIHRDPKTHNASFSEILRTKPNIPPDRRLATQTTKTTTHNQTQSHAHDSRQINERHINDRYCDDPTGKPKQPSEEDMGKDTGTDIDRDTDIDTSLDPLTRQMAIPFGIGAHAITPNQTEGIQQRIELARSLTLEQMLPSIVRKAAWSISPDRSAATLHLEIGNGAFEGTTVLIRADHGTVHIELNAPPGIDMDEWKNRLRLRIACQGLAATVS
ncbi:MAG: hypothetical protein FWD57_14495, partial [Polyangiaceae bacterium]|nr:hypothetical protein [Polyangiaceae bacterium]